MNSLLHDAGGMTLIWMGLLTGLTGVFHVLMICIPGESRCRGLFRDEDVVWCLRLLKGDMNAFLACVLLLLLMTPGVAFSEILMRWGFLWAGAGLQCLVLLYVAGCLFNTARRTAGGLPGLRLLMAFIISLCSVRMGWVLSGVAVS